MHALLVALLPVLALCCALAQPADRPTAPPTGLSLPLVLNLGAMGQTYVAVLLTPPPLACDRGPEPPPDVLQGPPGDLLRGPGTPRVDVQVKLQRATRGCDAVAIGHPSMDGQVDTTRLVRTAQAQGGFAMRLLAVLLPLLLGGCLSFSSSDPSPPPRTTVVVPPGSTVVCPNGGAPPC